MFAMKRILAFLSIISTVGCSMDIDAESSIAERSFGPYVEITCSHAEFAQEQYDMFIKSLPDNKRIPVEEGVRKEQARCKALKPLYDTLKEGYAELRSGYYWPRKRYLFQFVTEGADNLTVGFFVTKTACEEAKSIVSATGYEVKECYERTLFSNLAWD